MSEIDSHLRCEFVFYWYIWLVTPLPLPRVLRVRVDFRSCSFMDTMVMCLERHFQLTLRRKIQRCTSPLTLRVAVSHLTCVTAYLKMTFPQSPLWCCFSCDPCFWAPGQGVPGFRGAALLFACCLLTVIGMNLVSS